MRAKHGYDSKVEWVVSKLVQTRAGFLRTTGCNIHGIRMDFQDFDCNTYGYHEQARLGWGRELHSWSLLVWSQFQFENSRRGEALALREGANLAVLEKPALKRKVSRREMLLSVYIFNMLRNREWNQGCPTNGATLWKASSTQATAKASTHIYLVHGFRMKSFGTENTCFESFRTMIFPIRHNRESYLTYTSLLHH